MQLEKFSSYSRYKRDYCTQDRNPFFKIAAGYVTGKEKAILDIGSGEGEFFQLLKEMGKVSDNVYLLDGNEATVESNRSLTPHSVFYLAPSRLPFENGTVDFVHMSHLVDNLQSNDLYSFLVELDRVLRPGGYIVVSTPMLWALFYNDLSHTRPYNPNVFYKYFVRQNKNSRFDKVQGNYEMADLVYRYSELPLDEGWSSTVPFIDFFLTSTRKIMRLAGFKRLQKNGYTLVLRKTQ